MYVRKYTYMYTNIHTYIYIHSYIGHIKIPTLVGLEIPTLKGGHGFMKPSKYHLTNQM